MSKKPVFKKRPPTPEEQLLRGYGRKLTFEAIIKSLIFGLAAGFLASIFVSIISFAVNVNILWVSLLVWGLSAAGFTLLFYFKVFRTTLDKTAARVDGMGLDERVITMIEFAGSDNVIAQKQRADTADVLKSVTPQKMKFGKTKLFITFACIMGAIACAAVLMMSFSTYRAVKAEQTPTVERPAEMTREDKIIQEMLDSLRKTIAEAKIKETLRDTLNKMVDDLEASLRPEDSTAVKIAKISETSQKIHKILQDELAKTTIPQQLQTHDTTKKLGAALESGNFTRVEAAFTEMYNSIAVLAAGKKWVLMQQTAYDILESIEDADEKDEALIGPLEKLAQAFLDAIEKLPPPPEGGGEEDKVSDELDQAADEAIKDAMDAIKDAMDQAQEKDDKEEIENVDKDIQDSMQDAMDSLGKPDSSQDDKDDEENDDKKDEGEDDKKDDENTTGPAHPSEDGEIIYDSVIDGKTPYDTVYDEYYQAAMELLASGNLTDEQIQMIENYLKLLS